MTKTLGVGGSPGQKRTLHQKGKEGEGGLRLSAKEPSCHSTIAVGATKRTRVAAAPVHSSLVKTAA